MARRTRVSIVDQRRLNQAVIYAGQVPRQLAVEPQVFVRALRSALRMSQATLARRCGLPQAHIARLEAGTVDAQISTLRRLFSSMFCDLLILPLPRKRPSEALAEQQLKKRWSYRIWRDEISRLTWPRPAGAPAAERPGSRRDPPPA